MADLAPAAAVRFERLAAPARTVAPALTFMGDCADAAADAFEAFVHQLLHTLDGPGDSPCSRCAALLPVAAPEGGDGG